LAARETLVEHHEIDPWIATSAFEKNPALDSEPSYSWPPDLATVSKLRRDEAVALAEGVASGSESSEYAALTATEQELVADWDSDIELLLAQRGAVAPPVSAELPMTLSTTELLAARRDRSAFIASRRRPLPRPPSSAAARGTRFHTWVEERFGQRPLFDELPGALDEDLFMDAELADLQAGFLRTPYAELTPHAVEVPFAIVIGGRLIKGRIDAVYRVKSQWQVVDWKTNLRASADPTQLAIYRAAWAQLAGVAEEQIAGVFVYVRRGDIEVFNDLPSARDLLSTIR